MAMTLSSEAFGEAEPIPTVHTCEGEDQSPPLSWSGAPEGTQSFALICDDPDAPGGTFAHWAVYDIPADVGYLESGHSNPQRSSPYKEGVNDMGRASWGGPCPPEGHGTHHYHFRILALGSVRLDVPEGAKVPEVESAAREHVLDEARLIGIYER